MGRSADVLEVGHWDEQYRAPDLPWDTGEPSTELRRVLIEQSVLTGRAIELGCGTGANAVWLTQQGFDVTAIDLSPRAIDRAQHRAAEAGARVDFLTGNLLDTTDLQGPFDFFLDCGCYHAVRLAEAGGYLRTLRRILRPGATGLVLTGNAREPEDKVGPPVLFGRQLLGEWERDFEVLSLRPFRFDPTPGDGHRYLGWSCFVRRAPQVADGQE
jgi:methyl halide transferase